MSRVFHLPAGFAVEQTHADLIRMIVQYLELRQWLIFQTPAGGIKGEPGASDLFAFKAKRVVFIEAKVGRDKLSADQLRFKGDVERRGFKFVEARSLDDVIAAEG